MQKRSGAARRRQRIGPGPAAVHARQGGGPHSMSTGRSARQGAPGLRGAARWRRARSPGAIAAGSRRGRAGLAKSAAQRLLDDIVDVEEQLTLC